VQELIKHEIKLVPSYILWVLGMFLLVAISLRFSEKKEDRYLNLLLWIFGGTLGRIVGILISPTSQEQQATHFSHLGQI